MYFQDPNIQEQIRQFWLENYDVRHPMHNPEVDQRAFDNARK